MKIYFLTFYKVYLYIYLPNISNSTFTKSFFFRFFKLVKDKVWGIILISKYFFETFDNVNDTPLIEIEAFSSRNLEKSFLSSSNRIIQDLSIKSIFLIFAVVSTWPWIKWPEIFWPYISDFSKFINWLTFKFLKFDLFIVSTEI